METQPSPPRPSPGKPESRVYGLAGVVVLLGVTLAALIYFRPVIEPPSVSDLAMSRAVAAQLAIQAVRDHARRQGSYPASLGEAFAVPVALRYRRVEDGFELSWSGADGRTVTIEAR